MRFCRPIVRRRQAAGHYQRRRGGELWARRIGRAATEPTLRPGGDDFGMPRFENRSRFGERRVSAALANEADQAST
jgi:hypothetical protein